jgi:hypothetical protein
MKLSEKDLNSIKKKDREKANQNLDAMTVEEKLKMVGEPVLKGIQEGDHQYFQQEPELHKMLRQLGQYNKFSHHNLYKVVTHMKG